MKGLTERYGLGGRSRHPHAWLVGLFLASGLTLWAVGATTSAPLLFVLVSYVALIWSAVYYGMFLIDAWGLQIFRRVMRSEIERELDAFRDKVQAWLPFADRVIVSTFDVKMPFINTCCFFVCCCNTSYVTGIKLKTEFQGKTQPIREV